MPKANDRTNEIIEQGFALLTPAQGAEDRCVAEVLKRARLQVREPGTARILHFPQPRYFLMAAGLTLALSALVSYYAIQSAHRTSAQALSSLTQPVSLQPKSTAASSTSPASTTVAGRLLSTNLSSKAVTIGIRTRILLLPHTTITVLKEDKEATVIEIADGSVVFTVTPGGADKISIWAGPVLYKVVGTFFKIRNQSGINSVEVFHGVVSVESAGLPLRLVRAGEKWSDSAPTRLEQNTASAQTIASYEASLNHILSPVPSAVIASAPVKMSKSMTTTTLQPINVPAKIEISDRAVLNTMIDKARSFAESGRYDALKDYLLTISLIGDRERITQDLSNIAQQKTNLRKFKDAEDLYMSISTAWPQSPQCEEALMGVLGIREQRARSPQERLDIITVYLERFPKGQYGVEMGVREVELLRESRKAAQCYESISRFIERFPDHPKSEAFQFLAASLLRESLGRNDEALGYYRHYLAKYPDGKFTEEAMLWSIKLGEIEPTIGRK